MMEILSIADQSFSGSFTNTSRSVSLTFINMMNEEIKISTAKGQYIELFIPRDQATVGMLSDWKNVSSLNVTNETFIHHQFNIPQNDRHSFAFHLEIQPMKKNSAYLLIYKLSLIVKSLSTPDGFELLCPISEP